MTVRTLNMAKSPNGSLASSQPPNNHTGRSKTTDSHQSYPHSMREPLASDKPDYKPGITYASQDSLPKLPIPELDSTCEKYIDALKPLQNGREQADTAAAVAEFLESEGPELQMRLKKYATGKTSYIEQFCKFRQPVARTRLCLMPRRV